MASWTWTRFVSAAAINTGRYIPYLEKNVCLMKNLIISIICLLLIFSCSKDSLEPSDNISCTLIDNSLYSNIPANNLIGRLEFGNPINDIWGYKDSANEYALVGFGQEGMLDETTGIYIVNVSNPKAPFISSLVTNVGGWDIKTYQNYMYSVNGVIEAEGKIINIENPESPKIVGEFPGVHNIFITCDNLLILSDPGLRIYDLNDDPINPKLLWWDGTDNGHESAVLSNTLYDFHGFTGTNIYDISDPLNPRLISTITSDLIRFHHSGWINENESILIINDERFAGSAELGDDFTIWDISDKSNPTLLSKFKDLNSTLHNVHIIKDKAYFSYYSAGYRIFDIAEPSVPELIFEYDTDPGFSGKGLITGAFGVYALSSSGNVFISDMYNGLFIFGQ